MKISPRLRHRISGVKCNGYSSVRNQHQRLRGAGQSRPSTLAHCGSSGVDAGNLRPGPVFEINTPPRQDLSQPPERNLVNFAGEIRPSGDRLGSAKALLHRQVPVDRAPTSDLRHGRIAVAAPARANRAGRTCISIEAKSSASSTTGAGLRRRPPHWPSRASLLRRPG